MIEFLIIGRAKPAGSKRAFTLKTGRNIIVDTSGKEGKMWRHIVQDRAREAMEDFGGPLITGPVSLYVKFTLQRPKHHYGKGKNEGVLLPKFQFYKHVSKPDSTKLLRALEDALTGVVWKDDSQVYRQFAHKVYGERDETLVKIFIHDHETEGDV